MITRRTLLSALPLLLAGCATTSLPPDTERFSGRFYLKTFDGKRPDSVQGGYELEITPESTRLDLLNPLGGTAARLIVDARGATMERGAEQTRAETMAELTQQLFGLDLPFDLLGYWLKGQTAPGLPSETIDPDKFTQAQWKIEIRRRHSNGAPEFVKLDCLRRSLPQITLLLIVKNPQ